MRVMRTGLILALAVVFAILFVNVAFNEAAHAAATKPRAAAGVCAATIAQDLSIQVPKFTFDGSAFFATLKLIQAADGSYTANLIDFGSTTRTDCSAGDTGILVLYNNSYVLHIPSLTLGADSYWINFEHQPTSDGTVLFKISNYGNAITGYTGEGSAFLSLVKTTGISVSSTQYKLISNYPGGLAEQTVNITVLENQTYTPTAAETELATELGTKTYNVKATHSETEDTYNYNLQYFVPMDALRARGINQLTATPSASCGDLTEPSALESQLWPSSHSSCRSSSKAEAEKSGLNVFVESQVKVQAKDFAEKMGEMHFGEGGKGVVKGATTIMDAVSIWDIGAEHLDWMARLDAVEKCIEYPSDLTLKAYAEDPTLKQRNIDQLNETRADIWANSVNRGVVIPLGTALDTLTDGFTSPLTGASGDFVENANKLTSEQLVREMEKAVPCGEKWKGTATYRSEGIPGSTCSRYCRLELTFELMRTAEDGIKWFKVSEGSTAFFSKPPCTLENVTFSGFNESYPVTDTDTILFNINTPANTYSAVVMAGLGRTASETVCGSSIGCKTEAELIACAWITGENATFLPISTDGRNIKGSYSKSSGRKKHEWDFKRIN